ncbi:MAG: DMT family transporter [Bacteroidetes bacterium]|nr:DMT family transporter [Bacteroidota bacterium]
MSKKVKGSIAIGISAVMWGFDGVVLTPRLFNLDVGYVVFILHLIPFMLMNIFMYKQYRFVKDFTTKDIIVLLSIAFTGGALGTLSIVKALFLVNFQHLSIVVLLQKLQPIFAILLAAVILKEKLTLRFLFWGLLAIAAGYTLTFEFKLPVVTSDRNTILAAVFALLAAFSFGSSTVFSKMVLGKYDFKTVTFFRYGFTALLMLFYVMVTQKFMQFSQTTANNWLFFIIIGLTTGSGAIFLYYLGLKHVSAIISVIVELIFPISAIIFDYIFNDARLSLIQWLSAAVMVFAIIKISYRRKKLLKRIK